MNRWNWKSFCTYDKSKETNRRI